MDSNTVFQLVPDVSHQDMGQGQPTVILRLSDGQLYTCNQTTQRFLEQVNGERTLREIAEALYEIFEVELSALQTDLLALAKTLIDSKLIQRA